MRHYVKMMVVCLHASLALLFVLTLSQPAFARASTGARGADESLARLVKSVPPAMGGFYQVVRTSVPGLQVVITIPLTSAGDVWQELVDRYPDAAVANERPPIEDTPFWTDPRLDNREWLYFSLWDVTTVQPTMVAAASWGKFNGTVRSAVQLAPQTAAAERSVAEWTAALTDRARSTLDTGSGPPADLWIELLLHTEISGHHSVWDLHAPTTQGRLEPDCVERWGPISGNPDRDSCRECCTQTYAQCVRVFEYIAAGSGILGCLAAGGTAGALTKEARVTVAACGVGALLLDRLVEKAGKAFCGHWTLHCFFSC